MKNIDFKVEKDKLTITVDLKKRFGASKSGKSITIASTEGNQKVGHGEAVFGLNVYTKEGTGG